MPVSPSRLLPLVLLVLALPVPAMADLGGTGIGWLASDRAEARSLAAPPGIRRGALALVRSDDTVPADPPVPPPEREPDPEGAALGAAFNADLLMRRRARQAAEEAADPAPAPLPLPQGGAVAGLRDLIASVEAGKRGYDAIHHSARALPARDPTDLTLAEIRAWVAATPGQQHAIGRYQFIPKTFESLVARLGLPAETRFTPAVQDRMANELLADAGLARFRQGKLDRVAFMHNLAAIWAGLPTSTGKSVYHGLAGNAAGMSWKDYDRRLAALFP